MNGTKFAFFALLLAFPQFCSADPVRVACLGDSLTFGTRSPNPSTQSYPAQLQGMLGPKWIVKNLSRSGATLWHGSNNNAFQQLAPLAQFQPDMVVVMFGTNDTRNEGVTYWDHFADFSGEARNLLDAILGSAKHPRILLCLPPANIAGYPGLTPERKAVLVERLPRLEQVRSKLREVAASYAGQGVELVDMFAVTEKRPEVFFSDAVHFKPEGYRLLAETLLPRIKALSDVSPAP